MPWNEITNNRKLQVDMKEHIEEMMIEFSEEISGSSRTPWKIEFFKINKNEKRLE